MKKIFVFCFSVVVILLIFAGVYALSRSKKTTTPPIESNPAINLLPAAGTTLIPGNTLIFRITFKNTVSKNEMVATLTKRSPGKENITVPTNMLESENSIAIQTDEKVEQGMFYSLELVTKTGRIILSADYSSPSITPTPLPSNNTQLKDYLPYDTSNFLLDYNNSRNLYVMHFKFRSSDPGTIEQQFEKAKRDAQEFITSKGIQVNTVEIEYSYK